MQSYFDRPNDTPDKTKIRSYHRIKIAINLKKIHVSVDQEKIFSILGPKLSGSKANQYYREKPLQIYLRHIVYCGHQQLKERRNGHKLISIFRDQ